MDFVDHHKDPVAWSLALDVSSHAVELYLASEVIDLHVDSFIWTRLFGYKLSRRHGRGLFGARFYSQVDFPRMREAQVGGATWVITTNPLRSQHARAQHFRANLKRLCDLLDSEPGEITRVRTLTEYQNARATGHHAAFIGVQGGNAVDADPALLDCLGPLTVLRVTLVHLSSSTLGTTSAPALRRGPGLTREGQQYVEALNAQRIFVDLAHISEVGFWQALEAHQRDLPPIVTHTGLSGVHPHWRNLSDEQVRAVADRGGVIGVMYHSEFLGDPFWGGRVETVVRHLSHLKQVGGTDCIALGSDWDGAIITPRDMPTCLELPRLAQGLLDAGFSDDEIQKTLGGNFLRCLGELRP